MEDGRNLGMVLNRLMREPKAADRLLAALRQLYADIVDFHVNIEGGTVQAFLREGDITVPAVRLSDARFATFASWRFSATPSRRR